MVSSTTYERKRLRKIAALASGPEILDIGYAQHPNPFLQNAWRTGLDLNKTNCDYEEKLVGNALDLKTYLENRQFDTIIAGEFIEHLEEPYAFLRSLRPHLKPEGKIIISTPNPVAFPTVFFEWTKSRRFFYTSEHKYYFPPRWVERLINQSGYEIDCIEGVGLWPFAFPPRTPSSLSYQVIYRFSPR